MEQFITDSGTRIIREKVSVSRSGKMAVSTPALGRPTGSSAKGDSSTMTVTAMRESGSMIRPRE